MIGGGLLRALGLQRPSIGLDVGTTAVKAVQLRLSGRRPVLGYAGLTEFARTGEEPRDRGVPLALTEILRRGRLRNRKMAIAYSGEGLTVRYLTLPKMPREELKEAVRWEAKKQVPHLGDESVLDYLVVGENEEKEVKRLDILLVVADKKLVLDQLDELRSFRPLVSAIDVNPLALMNGVKLNYREDIQENLVFVDIGATKMDISIAKRGILRFYRRVNIGGDDLTVAVRQAQQLDFQEAEALKRQLGLTAGEEPGENEPVRSAIRNAADRMILETQRSIDYYRAQFREGMIRKVILMGGTPLLSGFKDYFSTYFDSPVVVDDPFAGISVEQTTQFELSRMAPRFSTAVGLALRRGGE